MAVGAAAAQGVAVAGSLNLNFVRESVVASISSGQRGAGGRDGGRLGRRVRLRHDRGRQRRARPSVSGWKGTPGPRSASRPPVNDIANTVQAYVDGSTVTATAGSVQLQATEGATITAWTDRRCGRRRRGRDGVGVGLAGAGVGQYHRRRRRGLRRRTARRSTAQDGNVSLLASDSPTITADGGGVAIGVGAGGTGRGRGLPGRRFRHQRPSQTRSWPTSTPRR